MASYKNTFEAKTFAANNFAAGAWRGAWVVTPEPPTVSIGGGGAVGGGGPITKSRRKKKKKPLFADFSPDPPFPREFIEAEYEEEGMLIASMETWH